MKIWFLSGVAFCMFTVILMSGAKTSAADDQDVVAALDTQYQEAVKKNDAATMDRILTDDFILVTASGKTYNKADLLREARGRNTVYEHQEDTEQTVRVWGRTAVSPLSYGRRAQRTGSHSTTRCGSVTLMCGLRPDGAMHLANRRTALAKNHLSEGLLHRTDVQLLMQE